MHLRRALLLFAIVLGLAALAASVSRPLEERSGAPTTRPEPAPPTAPETQETARVGFSTGPPTERRRLEPGRAAVVTVEADEAGEVSLEGLGMNATAGPLTPARFDVLASEPITATVRFTPAGADEPQLVGTLEVSERGSARSGGRSATPTEPDR